MFPSAANSAAAQNSLGDAAGPRVARAVDLAIEERPDPVFIDNDGLCLDRHAAGRLVRRIARQTGINKRVGPHTLRHAFITAALDAGCRCATCRRPPRTPTREPRCATTVAGNPWTGTPPISSLRSSPALHADSPPCGAHNRIGPTPPWACRIRRSAALATVASYAALALATCGSALPDAFEVVASRVSWLPRPEEVG